MDNIYKNVVVTIAASASKNITVGIFDVLQDEPKDYGLSKLLWDSLPSEGVHVSTFKGDETMMDPMFRLPLATRGWALQERISSQRVLHFVQQRIYWQCRFAHISSDGNPPDGHAVLDSAVGALLKPFQSLDDLGEREKSLELQIMNGTWLKVVESYCRYRRLTFPTDKLPAIAGIASTLQKLARDAYLAGIWKSDWARGLLWITWDYTRWIRYRAPSWSWAR
jgi:hypothetical protein